MIEPTIGRIVWYFELSQSGHLAAIITKVHNSGLVNLTVFEVNGNTKGETEIHLIQDNQSTRAPKWCEWMPYQKGQAAKTESLEKKLTEKKD